MSDLAAAKEDASDFLQSLRSRRSSGGSGAEKARAPAAATSGSLDELRARQAALLATAQDDDDEEEDESEEFQEEELDVSTRSSGSQVGYAGNVPVSVLVRCRPMVQNAEASKMQISMRQGNGQGKVLLSLDPGAGGGSMPSRSSSRPAKSREFRCNGYISHEGTQEDVFAHTAPVVDRVMEGYNGVIFCYGITGSGKTYTMSGPPQDRKKRAEEQAPEDKLANEGIVQRASKRIFEFIRDRSSRGQLFTVEVSFLEIYSPDGNRETLVDLLVPKDSSEAKLEVRQDPLTPQAFTCEGLRTVPIRSPDEMREVLEKGRRRCTYMETSRNCQSSRSHCLFTVVIECLLNPGDPEPDVRRGKLVLVDLAGSESLKKVMAVKGENEDLRRKQAIGINRVLTHLGSVVNNLNAGYENSTGFRNSALTMLLRDCLGGGARALLVANIGPELEWMSETSMTLTFAQKMMKVKNVERLVVVDAKQSSLVQMRKRHEDCIARLKEKGNDEKGEADEEREALDREIEEIGKRLLTKDSATSILQKMQEEQTRKIQQFRLEITEKMADQFKHIQEESQKNMEGLRQAIEAKAKEGGAMLEQQQAQSREAQLTMLERELSTVAEARKAVEAEATDLRLRLAGSQQRAETLQELAADVAKQRQELEEERKELRQKSEEQGERLATLEREADRLRVEADVRREEQERLQAASRADAAAHTLEKDSWQKREDQLRSAIDAAAEELERQCAEMETQQKLATESMEAEVQSLKQTAQSLEEMRVREENEFREILGRQSTLELDLGEVNAEQADLKEQIRRDVEYYDEAIFATEQSAKSLEAMLLETQNAIMATKEKVKKGSKKR